MGVSRRKFLALGTAGIGVVTGCSGAPPATTPPAETETAQPSAEPTSSKSSSDDSTETTPESERSNLVVSPDGDDSNPGDREAPLGTIQEAVNRATAGDEIRLKPGVYRGGDENIVLQTRRAGEPGQPISIIGPPEAVIRGPPVENGGKLIGIYHSHIHLRGMTLDGLTRPDRPQEARWYRDGLVETFPPTWQDEYPDYLQDVVIEPRAIGNVRQRMIDVVRTNGVSIGDFELIGPAAASHVHGNADGWVIGEIIGLGVSSNNFKTEGYPWGPDQSHDIRIHHIANQEGHEHTELVRAHAGTHDVTIEYCTDTGGFGREQGGPAIYLAAGGSTVRWCHVGSTDEDNQTTLTAIVTPPFKRHGVYEQFDPIDRSRFPGINNAVYGNEIEDPSGRVVAYQVPDWLDGGSAAQRAVCGNTVGGEDNVPEPCAESVPTAKEIGHTGGDGPWS